MDTQLSDELDHCFGDGPAHRPVGDALHAGRRALRQRRRRQWAAGVAAVAAMATVGGWQASATPHADPPPAATHDGDKDADLTWRDLEPVPAFELPENQLFYDSDEALVVRPGVTVLSRVDDPWIVDGIDRSVAMITQDGSRTYWSFAWQAANDQASSSSVRPEEVHGATFEQWLADEIARSSPPGAEPGYLTLTRDGSVRSANGARIVDLTTELPARLAPDGYAAGAALLSVGDAEVCGVVRRAAGRSPEFVYLNASQYGPDLAGCLAGFGTWSVDVQD